MARIDTNGIRVLNENIKKTLFKFKYKISTFLFIDNFSISLKLWWPEKGFKVTLKPKTKPMGLPLTCALIGKPFFPEFSIQVNNSFHS